MGLHGDCSHRPPRLRPHQPHGKGLYPRYATAPHEIVCTDGMAPHGTAPHESVDRPPPYGNALHGTTWDTYCTAPLRGMRLHYMDQLRPAQHHCNAWDWTDGTKPHGTKWVSPHRLHRLLHRRVVHGTARHGTAPHGTAPHGAARHGRGTVGTTCTWQCTDCIAPHGTARCGLD